ncbi:AbiH family protein [Fructobacillus fructosus]|uniref:AbiH family protein n=1 Tax=Fructobacillus fructosus TaxID=1631 RepID=UPI0016589B8C|nr:AbiH family protein [Fructobacillus fructosus]MBC9119302.1 hypothetical protein [Fructobacillus fructosus]MBD9366871.1 hypothetical protein [Leuconostoc mesenteroides]
MKKKLVILGNGFDLHAGLKSSFQDFWNDRWPGYENIGHEDTRYVQTPDPSQAIEQLFTSMMDSSIEKTTPWDIIILYTKLVHTNDKYNRLKNWMDIEYIIYEVLSGNTSSKSVTGESLYSNGLIKLMVNYHSKLGVIGDEFFDIETNVLAALVKLFRIENKTRIGDQKEQEKIIADWLLKELNKFEKDFSDYLSDQIQRDSPTYQVHCYRILARINNRGKYNSDDSSWDPKLDNLDVLSFNYTNPFMNLNDGWHDVVYKVNNYRLIHGNLASKKIIFGFDSAGIAPSDSLISQFTKTSRLLEESIDNQEEWSIDTSYAEIAIYGHSLSEADYSYFQSLFDYINLYQCKTKLVFYFNINDQNKSAQIKKQYEHSITKLINRYGASFDNKEKGKNLLHKLLLENRISIARLKSNLAG